MNGYLRRCCRRTIGPGCIALLLAAAPLAPAAPVKAPSPPPSNVMQLSSDLRVAVFQGREIALQVRPGDADDYGTISRRVSGDDSETRAIRAWNNDARLEADRWIDVPIALLSDEFRSLVLRNLFPKDHRDGEDWIHLARSGPLSTYDEGLWQVAEWFGGRGAVFDELMRINTLSSPELRAGQPIRIPARLLHPAFQPRMRSTDGALSYASDPRGPYASYRLKAGEALYSSVVVNFTGRTTAEDVGDVARKIARRSAIPDPRDIPVGFEIKIPFDLLDPWHLPESHPRRLEAETRRAEVDRELAREPVAGTRGGLRGVVIVLDPGHGGRDLGTTHNGIWEHDYVYDVSCRLKALIETETAARVWMTLEDRETGCSPSRTDKLVANRQGTILTAPNFLAKADGDAKIGVNLRWYLANSIHRKSKKEGVRSDRVVFLSLHADARHPGLSGLMVYVPGANYRTRTYGSTSKTYARYKEVKEKPTIRFSKKERLRSEAVSRKLAAAIVAGFSSEKLPIQPYQPVRDKVIRGKEKWVPAVLRGNEIPAKVLVEMVNISNPGDASLLGSAADRERMARAILISLYRYFGEKSPELSASTSPR